MSNAVTSKLPGFVDSILEDIAQTFATNEGQTINYSDIMKFGEAVTKEELKEVKAHCLIIKDGYSDWDNDEEVYKSAAHLVDMIHKSILKGA